MTRFQFVLLFCGTWVVMDIALWAVVGGFDFQSVLSVLTLVPICAWLMPDRKRHHD